MKYFKADMHNHATQTLLAYIKPGFFVYSDIWRITIYMLPEVMITGLLMLNEIHLRLLGLYYVIELDIESVQDGISRINCLGDEEAV